MRARFRPSFIERGLVRVLLCSLVAAAGCGRGGSGSETGGESAGAGGKAFTTDSDSGAHELPAALDSFVASTARAYPVWGTDVGMHAGDGRLDDFSSAARKTRVRELHDCHRRLAAFRSLPLTVDDRVDLGVVLARIESELFDLEELRPWAVDPHRYTQLAGRSVHRLLVCDYAPLEARLDSITARLTAWPRLFEQARRNLERPPRVRCEAALRQCESLLRMLDDDLPEVAAASQLPAPRRRQLADAMAMARAAVVGFQDALAGKLMPRADGDFRLGPDRYERALQLRLRTSLTTAVIRERAIEETHRVRREMYDLALPMWRAQHPDQNDPAPDATGIDAVVGPALARIGADHPRPEQLLEACRVALDSLERFCAATDLVRFDSQTPLRVEWTPDFARGLAIAGIDPPATLDPVRSVSFYVQPVPVDWSPEQIESFLDEYNRDMLQVLVMHEAMPGHFVQLCRARQTPHRVRNVFANDAFVEGWAVYAERLVMDAGYAAGDVGLRLAACKFYLRSVLNARVDIGVHCDDMTEDEVITMLVEQGFQEPTEAHAKWIRAQLGATQLAAYFVGFVQLEDLEAADRTATGATWTRRDFVDRLLAHGSASVDDLRSLLADQRAHLQPAEGSAQ